MNVSALPDTSGYTMLASHVCGGAHMREPYKHAARLVAEMFQILLSYYVYRVDQQAHKAIISSLMLL